MPIIIELCERTMDRHYATVADANGQAVQEPRPNYHAQVQGQPGIWAAGRTPQEALGDLVRCHPEVFGVQFVEVGKRPR